MAWGLGRAVCLWLLLLSVLRLPCRGATVEEDSVAFDLVQRHLQVPDASKLSAAQMDVINKARASLARPSTATSARYLATLMRR